MIDIRDCTFQELSDYVCSKGEESFCARQVFEWLYKKNVSSFKEMRNIPERLKQQLKDKFLFSEVKSEKREVSSDGTVKILFTLQDKERVETVLIPTATRSTVCVSTQAGCKFGCRFYASEIGGWKRNLTSGEILSQILSIREEVKKNPLSHIVFMGVGEPLDTVALRC